MTLARLAMVACLLALLAALPMAGPVPSAQATAQAGFPPVEVNARRLRATINLLGYDPYWRGERQTRFRLGQFRDLRRAGFTAVRINLMAFEHMDAQHRLDPAWIERVNIAMTSALAEGLAVILDEHDHVACRKEPGLCGDRLQAFWAQMAPRFDKAPPDVIFEIMNEPGGPWDARRWNDESARALATIRNSNPFRDVIIGPACSNDLRCLKDLTLAEADRHIISTFHYYVPFQFTHQGFASNPQYAALSGVTWGSDKDLAALTSDFSIVRDWQSKHDRPIILGEFGVFDSVPSTERAHYVGAIARTAEKYGFGWGLWQFQMNFSLYDTKTDKWDGEMLAALFHDAPQSNPTVN